jgi:hypothetical protein
MGIREDILDELDCDIEFEAGAGYITYTDYGNRMTVQVEIMKMIEEGIIGFDVQQQTLKGGWFYRKDIPTSKEETTFVEFTYEGIFYHGYSGHVPNEIIAQGKQAMNIWLCENGEPMEYDYDAFANETYKIGEEEEKCSMCKGQYGPIINNEVCAVCTGIIEDEEEASWEL